MGLKEQLFAGATALQRQTIPFVVTGSFARYTGSVDIGRTFILLNAQTTTPCRVRLYGDAASRNDVNELARPYQSQSIPSNISLIIDTNLTDTRIFDLAPPLFGANLDNPIQSTVYYTVDTGSVAFSGTNTISFKRFLLEDPLVVGLPNVTTRETFIISGSIASGSSITGSIPTPKTHLLLQAIPNASPIRLRLYTSQSYRDNPTEVSRSIYTEPSSGAGLILDEYFDITSTASFTPIILGRNMDDLSGQTAATQNTYYNLTNGSATVNILASLYTFSIED